MKSKISVVLGTLNRFRYLQAAIESVRQSQLDGMLEIIVVDGGSKDGTLAWLAKQRDIITVIQHNIDVVDGKKVRKRSWGYFMNLGFKIAQGELICMLSDDCVVHSDAIANGLSAYREALNKGQKVGGVAFRWRSYPEESEYRVGYTLGGKMFVNHGFYVRKVLQEVGWLEEDALPFYFADGDVCLKMAAAGWEVICSEQSRVEHFESPKQGASNVPSPLLAKDWENYLRRWTGSFYDPQKPNIGEFTHTKNTREDAARKIVPPGIQRLISKAQSPPFWKKVAHSTWKFFGRHTKYTPQ